MPGGAITDNGTLAFARNNAKFGIGTINVASNSTIGVRVILVVRNILNLGTGTAGTTSMCGA